MIKKETIKYLSQLAKLNLTEEETIKIQKDLESILEYVEKLKKADMKKTFPEIGSRGNLNVSREDEEKNIFDKGINEKILSAATETKEKFVKVKSIFK